MKKIQLAVLLLSLILFSSCLYAQNSESEFVDLQKPASTLDELKIVLTDSTLSATFRNQTLPVSNIVQLDKYLKNNPELALQMKALIQSEGKVNPEPNRSLVKILNKNKIYNVRSISYNKWN